MMQIGDSYRPLERFISYKRCVLASLFKASPDSILIIVSNHIDVLTYIAGKLSGFQLQKCRGVSHRLSSQILMVLCLIRFQVIFV
ncbi:unnamed protein product [Arabidopsis thaliana]|uniref:Uncharacterized protein n=1 Tax=Arabidopsis thaliana TaxID=3702 RepID=A0A5S9WGW4_ARATH|nr:unnamed protein product [Arabidopsis thaliana]